MDHRGVEAALDVLLDAARRDDGVTLSVVWTEFERRLRGHMEGEEALLLPLFEAQHAEVAQRVRDDHATIRERLAKIGVLVDLHQVRLGQLLELQDLLKAHAEWEDRGIYEPAEQSRDSVPIQSFAQYLRGFLS